MRVICEMLRAEVICGDDLLDREVTSGFGCDLISDSLRYARPGCLLLTGLTNTQIIRLAEIVEAQGIVFVRGKKPGPEVVELARQKNLPLLATSMFLFESCGILYQAGLRSS